MYCIQAVAYHKNPYQYGIESKNIGTEVLDLVMTHEQSELEIKNLAVPIKILMKTNNFKEKSKVIKLPNPEEMKTEVLQITNTSRIVMVSVKLMDEGSSKVELITLIRYGKKPSPDLFDIKTTILGNRSWLTQGNRSMYARLSKDNTVSFSLSPLVAERNTSRLYISTYFLGGIPQPWIRSNQFTYDTEEIPVPWNVSMYISMPECVFWNIQKEKFDGDGCVVSI